MSNIGIRKALMIFMSCFIMLFLLSSCKKDSFWDKTYLDDIYIPLETREAEIVIREWHWLMGSGEEVYYKYGGGEILLGNLTGGDDGFCPFKAGLYSVTEDGNELIFEWSFDGSRDRNTWRKEVFALPDIPTAQENTDDGNTPWLTVGICGGVCVIAGVTAFLIVPKRKRTS